MNKELFYDTVFEPGDNCPASTVCKIIKQPFFGKSKTLMTEYVHSHYLVIVGSPEFVFALRMKYIDEVLGLDKRMDRYRNK